MVLAKRTIPQEEYEDWDKRYQEASSLLEEREIAMEKLQDKIESNLKLVGATAIEDKLQDDVGGTIDILKRAGIKVWVLTGDKIETAINIGYSCKLLSEEMELLVVDIEDISEKFESEKEENDFLLAKTKECLLSNIQIVSLFVLNLDRTKSRPEIWICDFWKSIDFCHGCFY